MNVPMSTHRSRVLPAVLALGFTALLTVTGCGGSTDSSPPATTTAAATAGDSGAVTQAFATFFSGGTTAADKIAVLQHGADFTDTIDAQADSTLAKSTTVQVTDVDMDAPDHATVTFTILMNGQPALTDQVGEAVRVGGTWKVAQATFCALLTLEGNAPPQCAPATTAPVPTS